MSRYNIYCNDNFYGMREADSARDAAADLLDRPDIARPVHVGHSYVQFDGYECELAEFYEIYAPIGRLELVIELYPVELGMSEIVLKFVKTSCKTVNNLIDCF